MNMLPARCWRCGKFQRRQAVYTVAGLLAIVSLVGLNDQMHWSSLSASYAQSKHSRSQRRQQHNPASSARPPPPLSSSPPSPDALLSVTLHVPVDRKLTTQFVSSLKTAARQGLNTDVSISFILYCDPQSFDSTQGHFKGNSDGIRVTLFENLDPTPDDSFWRSATPFDWVLLMSSADSITQRFLDAIFATVKSYDPKLWDNWSPNKSQQEIGAGIVGVSLRPSIQRNSGMDVVHTHRIDQQLYLLMQPQVHGSLYCASGWLKYGMWVSRVRQTKRYSTWPSLYPSLAVRREESLERGLLSFLCEVGSTILYIGHNYPIGMKTNASESLFHQIPTLSIKNIPSFDCIGSTHKHEKGNHPLKPIDMALYQQCSMVITVYDRHDFLLNRLKWYHSMLYLRQIIVIWNNLEVVPPDIPDATFRIPVHILKMKVNSMNNRFLPNPLFSTDCIVNMDDDWDMPHSIINYAVRLWRYSYSMQLVGLHKNARTHGVSTTDGLWKYLKNASAPQSILLPSGMVYHRRYLNIYSNETPKAALNIVDDLMNCDDILFNFMVANHTNLPPVFVRSSGINGIHALTSLGKKRGLWTRTKHYTDRDICIKQFAQIYNGMKLQYTSQAFTVDPAIETIFPDERHLVSEYFLCRTCEGPADKTDDCVECGPIHAAQHL